MYATYKKYFYGPILAMALFSCTVINTSVYSQALPAPTFHITEGITGALRFPAGYLEYQLRDNPSTQAHLIKILINTIRIINSILAVTNHNSSEKIDTIIPLLWTGFDAYNLQYELVEFVNKSTDNIPETQGIKKTTTNADAVKATKKKHSAFYAFLIKHQDYICGTTLPFIEATCATLHAAEYFSPQKRNLFFSIGSIARLSQMLLLSKKGSNRQQFVGLLLAVNAAYVFYKLYDNINGDNPPTAPAASNPQQQPSYRTARRQSLYQTEFHSQPSTPSPESERQADHSIPVVNVPDFAWQPYFEEPYFEEADFEEAQSAEPARPPKPACSPANKKLTNDDCPYCLEKVSNPVEFPCHHGACNECFKEWDKERRKPLAWNGHYEQEMAQNADRINPRCPLCRESLVPVAEQL